MTTPTRAELAAKIRGAKTTDDLLKLWGQLLRRKRFSLGELRIVTDTADREWSEPARRKHWRCCLADPFGRTTIVQFARTPREAVRLALLACVPGQERDDTPAGGED